MLRMYGEGGRKGGSQVCKSTQGLRLAKATQWTRPHCHAMPYELAWCITIKACLEDSTWEREEEKKSPGWEDYRCSHLFPLYQLQRNACLFLMRITNRPVSEHLVASYNNAQDHIACGVDQCRWACAFRTNSRGDVTGPDEMHGSSNPEHSRALSFRLFRPLCRQ